MDDKLLNLPWEIQLALGSGYAAYMLAYLGIRGHHKPIDIAFRAIAFGLVATAMLKLLPVRFGFWRIAAAAIAPLIAGLLWRKWFSEWLRWVARLINHSWSDETPSAWHRVTQQNSRFAYSQLSIQLDDDSRLYCCDLRDFADAPFGPCLIGPDGDVALYVTHKCDRDGEIEAVTDVRDPQHGDELTWVPASRIRKVRVRLWRPPTSSAPAEEVPLATAEEP